MVVGARQSFQFFSQITWSFGNNRALSKYRYQILHNLISITKLQKNHSVKANFRLTTRTTLTFNNRRKRYHDAEREKEGGKTCFCKTLNFIFSFPFFFYKFIFLTVYSNFKM